MHHTTQALLDHIRTERARGPSPDVTVPRLHALDAWEAAGYPDASQPKNGPHVSSSVPGAVGIEVWRDGEIVSTSQLVWRRFGRYAVIEHWRSESVFIRNLRVLVGQTDPAGGAQISWLDPTTGTTRPSAAEWLVHPSTLELL